MIAAVVIPTLEILNPGHGLGINQFELLPDVIQLGMVTTMFAGEFNSMLLGWKNPKEAPFKLNDDYQPGNLGFGNQNYSDPFLLSLMDRELNNGRLAMFGALGMIVQELVTHQSIF